jgi:hypothetical protein
MLPSGTRIHVKCTYSSHFLSSSHEEQLQEIVKLASRPLPDCPWGMVCVAIYIKRNGDPQEYEMLARNNPASLFLMNTNINMNIKTDLSSSTTTSSTTTTTMDVYSAGQRVARIVGDSLESIDCITGSTVLTRLQHVLDSYAPRSTLELSSAVSSSTTEMEEPTMEYDFESSYGNWLPNVDD